MPKITPLALVLALITASLPSHAAEVLCRNDAGESMTITRADAGDELFVQTEESIFHCAKTEQPQFEQQSTAPTLPAYSNVAL